MDNFIVSVLLALTILSTCGTIANSHKILLYPLGFKFNSHILDLIRMSEILHDADHEVHFLTGTTALSTLEKTGCPVHTYQTQTKFQLDLPEMIKTIVGQDDEGFKTLEMIKQINDEQCEQLLGNDALFEELMREKFDLILGDNSDFCLSPIINKLKVPAIIYEPIGFVSNMNFPNYPSFMPTFQSKYSTKMDFGQRIENTMTAYQQ